MSEMDDLRARLRNADRQSPGAEGYGHILFGALAFLGFAVGAVAVLFTPIFSPMEPSASVPTFESARGELAVREPPLPQKAPIPAPTIDYSAEPEALASAADSACFQRAQARYPSFSKTPRLTTKQLSDFDLKEIKHFGELMHCLLTESPVRYCSAGQRRMITAEIVTYFRGIDSLNTSLAQARKMQSESQVPTSEPLVIPVAEADPRVAIAIEARLRDGLLTRADYDKVRNSLPVRLRERLANVPVGSSRCPPPPWWAFWR
jgi:hypothetical protein